MDGATQYDRPQMSLIGKLEPAHKALSRLGSDVNEAFESHGGVTFVQSLVYAAEGRREEAVAALLKTLFVLSGMARSTQIRGGDQLGQGSPVHEISQRWAVRVRVLIAL